MFFMAFLIGDKLSLPLFIRLTLWLSLATAASKTLLLGLAMVGGIRIVTS